MNEFSPHSKDRSAAIERAVLMTQSAAMPEVEARFDAAGVMGVLLVNAEFLRSIERKYGDPARTEAFQTLSGLVRQIAREKLAEGDFAVTGELGRHEIVVLLFRESGGARISRQEIPGFDTALRQRLESNAGKAFYPYLRTAPKLINGSAICIRNPRFSVESQLCQTIAEARQDAELNVRIEARDRRKRLSETMLDRKIHAVYEPIVEVDSRVVFGYESLARGPEGTEFHSPVALFQAAAEEDMVFELDCLCRASGLRGAVDFPSGTKLFLNILPTTIHDPNFREERLIKTLEECRLSPSDVVFEISEQESIENFADFKEVRDKYRQLGFQFALDDTGSGYAGLEALLELTPEFIKMDRAFVSGVDQDPARQDLLAALLTLAEKMGSKVIGEGLDTLEELEMLGKLGIHYGQGWLFGRPTPLRAAE